jgi:uracil-DNA glycosylase family 4
MKTSIDYHKDQFHGCLKCPIGKQHKVFYWASSNDPKICFIADSPGPDESILERPMAGIPGKLFRSILREAGVGSWAITYLVACPTISLPEKRFREATQSEINNCSERLVDFFECFNFEKYVSIGKLAKKNIPKSYACTLNLDHPIFIHRCGGTKSLEYKRNVHKLRKFIEE